MRAGDSLGNYQIVSELSRGGMGVLYLARREGLGGFAREAAIKTLSPHLANDPAFVDMFLDEARLCARIVHPNVVGVEEVGQHGDVYYIVMQYVRGCSLMQLLRALSERGRALKPDVAVSIALQVADGLHAAHEAVDDSGRPLGVVHRDVSPHNVMISSTGHVKVIDFGIAKARGRLRETKDVSVVKGKLRYMAPEQLRAQPLDRRTDVYALGIVLWEMLTSRRLFPPQDDPALLDLLLNPQVEPPSRYASAVSTALDAVTLRALALDPADRYPTAHAMKLDLARACPDAAAYDFTELAELVSVVVTDADRNAGVTVEAADKARQRTIVGVPTTNSPAGLRSDGQEIPTVRLDVPTASATEAAPAPAPALERLTMRSIMAALDEEVAAVSRAGHERLMTGALSAPLQQATPPAARSAPPHKEIAPRAIATSAARPPQARPSAASSRPRSRRMTRMLALGGLLFALGIVALSVVSAWVFFSPLRTPDPSPRDVSHPAASSLAPRPSRASVPFEAPRPAPSRAPDAVPPNPQVAPTSAGPIPPPQPTTAMAHGAPIEPARDGTSTRRRRRADDARRAHPVPPSEQSSERTPPAARRLTLPLADTFD